jgi:hypothetical protein
MTEIPGYDYGTPRAAHSPLTLDELRHLEETVGWTNEDADALRKAEPFLREHAEEMVDSWRARIANQPHLAKWFIGPDGKPDDRYKAAVKKRFVQWVIDTAIRPHDQAWLDYQEEIGLRHTPAKKNKTEGADTPNIVPLRYLIAFVGPTILGAREFFAKTGESAAEVDKLQEAWSKSVLLHIALWSRPYTREGLW